MSLSRQRQLNLADFQLSLTRQAFPGLAFRALKHTAQLILSLRDSKGNFNRKALKLSKIFARRRCMPFTNFRLPFTIKRYGNLFSVDYRSGGHDGGNQTTGHQRVSATSSMTR